jgi:hypothetical protein
LSIVTPSGAKFFYEEPKRESCTSETARDEDGNIPIYPATSSAMQASIVELVINALRASMGLGQPKA